jgi:hypothetical protein
MDVELWFFLLLGLVILAAAWIILRNLLRLTVRIFSCGCSTLLGLGVLFIVFFVFSSN